MSGYFLWPKPGLTSAFDELLSRATVASLENALGERFPGAQPVVVSSGRAGLSLILAQTRISRGDSIGIFPYASHCVLDAVSRFTLPIVSSREAGYCRHIVYHQWGYAQHRKVRPWIEDAVDSLYLPDRGVLELGGEFELWSLPKIFGVLSGGVVWCRDVESADKLRTVRDGRPGTLRQFFLRGLGSISPTVHAYWAGVEAACGPMSSIASASALRALNKLDAIIADRRRKFELIRSFSPAWLVVSAERLPCAVPVEISEAVGEQLTTLGFITGFRHYLNIMPDGSEKLIRVFPIPIHQQVPIHLLERAVEVLEASSKNSKPVVPAYVA